MTGLAQSKHKLIEFCNVQELFRSSKNIFSYSFGFFRCGHVYHSECMAGTTGTEGNWICMLCNKTGLSRLSSWKGKRVLGKSVKPLSPGSVQVCVIKKFFLLSYIIRSTQVEENIGNSLLALCD